MPPQRPNLILPSHVPNVELDILIRDRLDVEADSRDGGDVGVELELVEDRYGHSHSHNQSRLLRSTGTITHPVVGDTRSERKGTYLSFPRRLSPA